VFALIIIRVYMHVCILCMHLVWCIELLGHNVCTAGCIIMTAWAQFKEIDVKDTASFLCLRYTHILLRNFRYTTQNLILLISM